MAGTLSRYPFKQPAFAIRVLAFRRGIVGEITALYRRPADKDADGF